MSIQQKSSTKQVTLPLQYTHRTQVKWPINSLAFVRTHISDFSSKSRTGWEADNWLAELHFKLNCPLYLSVIFSYTFSASSSSVLTGVCFTVVRKYFGHYLAHHMIVIIMHQFFSGSFVFSTCEPIKYIALSIGLKYYTVITYILVNINFLCKLT